MGKKKNNIIKLIQNKKEREPKTIRYKIDDEEIIIKVKDYISLKDSFKMANEIFGFIIDGEGYNINNYNPHLRDIAIRSATILYFTDVNLPSDTEKLHQLLFNTTLYDDVVESMDLETTYSLWSSIINGVDEKIRGYVDICTHNKQFNDLVEYVKSFIAELPNAIKQFDPDKIMQFSKSLKGENREDIGKELINLLKK